MVGQSEYSLMPVPRKLARRQLLQVRKKKKKKRSCFEHTLPQRLILQHIVSGKLGRVHALHAQDLYGGAREAALRCFRCALHEQHDRRRRHRLIDGLTHLVREEAVLGRREPGRRPRRERGGRRLPEHALMGVSVLVLLKKVRLGGEGVWHGVLLLIWIETAWFVTDDLQLAAPRKRE